MCKFFNVKRMDMVEYRYDNKKVKGIVIQNNIGNKHAPTTIVIEYKVLDRKLKLRKPYLLLKQDGKTIALELSTIKTISKTRITKKLGKCDHEQKVDRFLEKIYKNNHFDVVYALLQNTEGSEQSGLRPCVYIKNHNILIPLTTQVKKVGTLPTHFFIKKNKDNNLEYDSVVISEHIREIDKSDIKSVHGEINDKSVINSINRSIKIAITEKSRKRR